MSKQKDKDFQAIINSFIELRKCINSKCTKQQNKLTILTEKIMKPLYAKLSIALKNRDKKQIKIILEEIKVETHKLITTNPVALNVDNCTAKKCNVENRKEITNALVNYKKSCAKGDEKFCKLKTYAEDLIKNKKISGKNITHLKTLKLDTQITPGPMI